MTGYRDFYHLEATKHVVDEIGEERARQRNVEKWSTAHDDAHGDGSLVKAAACYALGATSLPGTVGGVPYRKIIWPRSWAICWWKPGDRRRDLVKAGALIVAEIERLDRAASKAASS